MKKKKISLLLAYLYIALSIGGICGPAYYGLRSYHKWKQTRKIDPSYTIKAIVQSTTDERKIPSEELEKMMGLSKDFPQNLFCFDLKEAKKKVRSYPIIKKVKLKKVKPSTIYVQYQLRKPYLRILNHDNIALDKEGYVFPLEPVYKGMEMPGILVGSFLSSLESVKCNVPQKGRCIRLALEMFSELFEYEKRKIFDVKKLDLTNAYAESYGKREILLHVEEKLGFREGLEYIFPKVLRLSTKGYSKQLGDYLVLHEKMMNDYRNQLSSKASIDTGSMRFATTTVDLRIPSIAFIDNH